MKKLIETALPLAEINEASAREKAGKPGNPANLHMWWGRSPEASSVAALASAMLDYSEETASDDMKLLASAASGNADALAALRRRLADGQSRPAVWDAFAGFGGIPIAAQKLGLTSRANDLNPVAAMLTGAVVDIPARFAGLPPVHPDGVWEESYSGAQGLAEDIRFYGEWVENQALKRLAGIYPQTETGEVPFAWLWVRSVKCSNPACGCRVPLASSYLLHKTASEQCWVEPVIDVSGICFVMHEDECPEEKTTNRVHGNGTMFRCPVCGEILSDEYIKKTGAEHQLGVEMMAVAIKTGGQKKYVLPDAVQKSAAEVAVPEDVPPGAMSTNTHWFSPPEFGFTEYSDLFTPRQMLMLSTFSDLIKEAQDLASSAALAAGMSEHGGPIEAGGTGALAYGQAVGIYLAFVVDRMADYNSSMCSWRTTGGNIRSTFGRQAIPMAWTFAEGNPFSDVSGNFKSILNSVAESVSGLSGDLPAIVTQDNAVTMEHPENVLVCTELPYYRDIGYADLSDFFYIWLRRSLKYTYPQLFIPMVTSKEELSTVSTYCGTSKEEAEGKYRNDMGIVCEKLYHSCSEEYPALLFYCFRKNDLESMKGGVNESAWEFMLESLLSVGFAVTAVWPMRSGPASEKADSTRVLIVARKGEARKGQITRRGFITDLKRELPERSRILRTGHILPDDELLSCIGQGIGVFSQYETVLNADGSAMSIHDALQVIYQECMNDIARRQGITQASDSLTRED